MFRFLLRLSRALIVAFAALVVGSVMYVEGERIADEANSGDTVAAVETGAAQVDHQGQPAFTNIESSRRRRTIRAEILMIGGVSLALAGLVAPVWVVASSLVRLLRGDRAQRTPSPEKRWSLDAPLLRFSRKSVWTIGAACQGCQIWGSTGSGKSTGSLAAICQAFLRAGFGGVFLTCKPDDRAVYPIYEKAGELGVPVAITVGPLVGRYDDPIKIRTSIAEATRIKLTFSYQAIQAESGQLLAEGLTVPGDAQPSAERYLGVRHGRDSSSSGFRISVQCRFHSQLGRDLSAGLAELRRTFGIGRAAEPLQCLSQTEAGTCEVRGR